MLEGVDAALVRPEVHPFDDELGQRGQEFGTKERLDLAKVLGERLIRRDGLSLVERQ